MDKQINKMLLRRKSKLLIGNGNQRSNKSFDANEFPVRNKSKELVSIAMKNIQAFGFTFSEDLFKFLTEQTEDFIKEWYLECVEIIKEHVGADKVYNPMYPNFPKQVEEMDDLELFLNAIVHYWSMGTLLPNYQKEERFPMIDDPELKVLSLATQDDVYGIFINLVSSKTNLSKQDQQDIATMISWDENLIFQLPDEIPLKENVAYISKLIVEHSDIANASQIQKYYNTATDVLRFVTALSDGDISLATNTKYKKLRRCERRMVMDLLEGLGNDILEDLFRYREQWLRIGEIIHPGEFHKDKKYDKVIYYFNYLRNLHKPLFYRGKIESLIEKGEIVSAAKFAKTRPGDFARKLNELLSKATNNADRLEIIKMFEEVAVLISSPVLLQVREFFIHRNNNKEVRVFFPKGNVAKVTSVSNNLVWMNDWVCEKVIGICTEALIEQYKSRDYLGNIYIDDEFKNYIVPFSQRSASSGKKCVTRGSSFPVDPDAKAIRGFIWWTNTEQRRVDIDLSAAVYDDKWKFIEHVSYTRLRSDGMKMYHSGDITNGGDIDGDGATEFLDVDINSVVKNNARYVVFQVMDYTNIGFDNLPNCKFGWMERQDVHSGEIYEPRTVKNIIDLTAQSYIGIPIIFDCVERKVIWCDLNLAAKTFYGGNNLESNLKGTTAVCYAMTHIEKPNLYDLVLLNAHARGKIVSSREEADIIFSNDTTKPVIKIPVYSNSCDHRDEYFLIRYDEEELNVNIITAFDTDYYMGELL